ncbi:stage III sporulation protein AE [Paenibacillus turpanensis]|uniref:stage III sporulation protein AE n=1 Tax=Paenibacillus turpanensis TaxID=2689078 RepID=UPI001408C4F2|nr:stage III sporulation protein AE [Paenibacillus turpanensis]
MHRYLIAIAAALFLLLSLWPLPAEVMAAPETQNTQAPTSQADPLNGVVRQQAEEVPSEQVEQYWDRLMENYGEFLPIEQTPTLMEMLLPGGEKLNPVNVIKGLAGYFIREIILNGKLLGSIVILAILSVMLETLQSAFVRAEVSKIAYGICYMVLIIIAFNSFHIAITYANDAIADMIHFMIAMIPVLLTMLASMGNVISVTVLHPLIVFMIHTVGTFIYVFVFPLLFFSAVLHIVSSLSEKYKVTQLANMLRTISIAGLTIMLTIFLGVISVQGAAGGVADGVTLKTAKYITGQFVPVVGRMFAEASDTVISASMLIKNAVGLAGVIIILLLCAFPAMKILALAFIYNLCAAVMQPLGTSPIGSCLQTIGKSLIYVFAALATVGLMFFFAITVMITVGNVSLMVR